MATDFAGTPYESHNRFCSAGSDANAPRRPRQSARRARLAPLSAADDPYRQRSHCGESSVQSVHHRTRRISLTRASQIFAHWGDPIPPSLPSLFSKRGGQPRRGSPRLDSSPSQRPMRDMGRFVPTNCRSERTNFPWSASLMPTLVDAHCRGCCLVVTSFRHTSMGIQPNPMQECKLKWRQSPACQ